MGQALLQAIDLALIRGDVRIQLNDSGIGLAGSALQTFAQIPVVVQLLLDPRDLATDPIERCLHRIEVLAGGDLRVPFRFDLGLGLALLGGQFLDAQFKAAQGFGTLAQFSLQRRQMQRFQLGIDPRRFALELLITLGLLGLTIEVFELLLDFLAHVIQPIQILARGLDPRFGFFAAFFVFGNASGFFQVRAQVFGSRLDNLRNHALLDDRVAARAQAGTKKHIDNVAAPTAPAVQEIVGLAIATDRALDRNLVEVGVFALDGAVGIVEDQLHLGGAHRLAIAGAREDHIGNRIAAQAAGGALAHHPADGVDDVGFAATIGPNHAGHIGWQVQRGRVHKRLEARKFDRRKSHFDSHFSLAVASPADCRLRRHPLTCAPYPLLKRI